MGKYGRHCGSRRLGNCVACQKKQKLKVDVLNEGNKNSRFFCKMINAPDEEFYGGYQSEWKKVDDKRRWGKGGGFCFPRALEIPKGEVFVAVSSFCRYNSYS